MDIPTASCAAWDLVGAHERSASDDDRAARGAWYTPREVVEDVVGLAFGPGLIDNTVWIPDRVVDPTCGAGAFLLGVLDRLVASGVDPASALSRVAGSDIDAGAVEACRAVLAEWASTFDIDTEVVAAAQRRVTQSDALDPDLLTPDLFNSDPTNAGEDTSTGAARFVTLVIGNPPFATPLRGRALPDTAVAFREQHRDRFGPYADLAALHLAAALDGLREGDRLALVLPQSVVSSRDLAGLRSEFDRRAPVMAAWATDRLVFEANVRVWAPVFDVGGSPSAHPWRLIVADALGGPVVDLSEPCLDGLVEATAGFRDEYYGLAEACRESGEGTHAEIPASGDELKICTVGSLDPLWAWWGAKPTTFAKQRWVRPVVDAERLEGRVGRWVEQLRRPKVLLPTQSRVFEPVIDHDGSLVPVTPVLALWPASPGDGGAAEVSLEHLAAMLLSPPLVAWARRNWFGAAMSTSAIKLPAAGLAELPLPVDRVVWDEAAALIADRLPNPDGQAVHELVDDVATLMNSAYGPADESVLEWWRLRLGRTPSLQTRPSG